MVKTWVLLFLISFGICHIQGSIIQISEDSDSTDKSSLETTTTGVISSTSGTSISGASSDGPALSPPDEELLNILAKSSTTAAPANDELTTDDDDDYDLKDSMVRTGYRRKPGHNCRCVIHGRCAKYNLCD